MPLDYGRLPMRHTGRGGVAVGAHGRGDPPPLKRDPAGGGKCRNYVTDYRTGCPVGVKSVDYRDTKHYVERGIQRVQSELYPSKKKRAKKETSKKHPSEAFEVVSDEDFQIENHHVFTASEIAEYKACNPDNALGSGIPPERRNALQHLNTENINITPREKKFGPFITSVPLNGP